MEITHELIENLKWAMQKTLILLRCMVGTCLRFSVILYEGKQLKDFHSYRGEGGRGGGLLMKELAPS